MCELMGAVNLINSWNMKSRTCPNCGYKYSLSEYYRKVIFNFSGSTWNCSKCGSELAVNSGKRLILIAVGILPIFFNYFIVEGIMSYLQVSIVLGWIVFGVTFLLWYFFVTSFEGFVLTKERE